MVRSSSQLPWRSEILSLSLGFGSEEIFLKARLVTKEQCASTRALSNIRSILFATKTRLHDDEAGDVGQVRQYVALDKRLI